ncbi:YebC/PmpR family DNA-binding transcriptional regulator [bacterium]|jgi:transcriptional/translational regulatory protein YebC/TACO1|nr:YebC/PmpR family DNA-binding transcriptional regulator [bacterium]
MSGHSKWNSIKHKKAAIDAKRGKVFSRISKELTVAAKVGGGDPVMNPRLRTVLLAAKEANMPQDNIEKAIKKGTGELPGVSYEETVYECYGPGGVAIMVDALTDNKNRTTSEIRSILSKKNGSMAGAGAVAWMFNKKAYFGVKAEKKEEENIMEQVIDAGVDDIAFDEENNIFEITAPPENFEKLRKLLETCKYDVETSSLTFLPSSYIKVQGSEAQSVLSLIDALEDHDDVQNVYSNFDISSEEIEKFENG